ncbi:MAG: threonine--tRNA ligase [Nanoarchaeota archaeon]|nr:threonine--tRNA ligase [Nanoarchaeota archaeon]
MEKKIKISFPDGNSKEYLAGVTAKEIVAGIGRRLADAAIAAKVNDTLTDLTSPIAKDAKIEILTFDSKDGKAVFWHSANHVMAAAVKELFPDTKLGVGPAIENGFYYDFDCNVPFTPADLEKIEKKMEELVKKNIPIKRIEVSKEEAIKQSEDEPYRIELIKELPKGEKISLYEQGEFTDLCRGPHVESTGKIKAFKLTKIAGAYWKGDAKNKQLQRIYGVAFPEKKLLDEYLHLIEEAEKRNHRKIGKELDLFSFHDEGPGFPFFLPKGMILKNLLIDFWRKEHTNAGYVEIQTPIMLNKHLWETSGHWMNYRENMYLTKIDNEDFAIKPMNCPGGLLMYKEKVHSYKEFPLRVGELGIVHRHELSGVLSGLFRVRVFTQDDAHIFMMPEQIKDEIIGVMNLIDKFYKLFGFEYRMELSTRPEKSIGTEEQWTAAENGLKSALDSLKKEYKINPGDGAFYGPKIDFHIKDALGRNWQCGTIQLDMNLPERFDIYYVGEDNSKHRPVMIHRVIYGSIERFIGIITEHFAGKFPLWLAPVQVSIITVADRFMDYANEVKAILEEAGIRVETDYRSESISYKIREGQSKKIPYILTIGEKEETNKTVSARNRLGKTTFGMNTIAFVEKLKEEIEGKSLEQKIN